MAVPGTGFAATGVNPVDIVERIAARRDWAFGRAGADEIAVERSGQWCGYRILVSLHPEAEALFFVCAFEMRIRRPRTEAIYPLLAIINERLPVGHFDLWSNDGLPVFRHAFLLRGPGTVTAEQIEDLFEIALAECERYYPAFQFVMWAGKTPREAIEAAILETAGEA